MDKERPPYGLPAGGGSRRPQRPGQPQQDGEADAAPQYGNGPRQPQPELQPHGEQRPNDRQRPPERQESANHSASDQGGSEEGGRDHGEGNRAQPAPPPPPRPRDWRSLAERKSAEVNDFGQSNSSAPRPQQGPPQPATRAPAWQQAPRPQQGQATPRPNPDYAAPPSGPDQQGAGRLPAGPAQPQGAGYTPAGSAQQGGGYTPAGSAQQGGGHPPAGPSRQGAGTPPAGPNRPGGGYPQSQPQQPQPPQHPPQQGGVYPAHGEPGYPAPPPDGYGAPPEGQMPPAEPGYGPAAGPAPDQPPPHGVPASDGGHEQYGDDYAYAAAGDPPGQYDEVQSGAYDDLYRDATKQKRRRPALLIGMLAGVAVIASGLIFAYQYSQPDAPGDGVPVVSADDGPAKIQPEDPGGVKIPQQTKLIYERIVGDREVRGERVVPREEPVLNVNPDQQSSTDQPGGDQGNASFGEPRASRVASAPSSSSSDGQESGAAPLDSGFSPDSSNGLSGFSLPPLEPAGSDEAAETSGGDDGPASEPDQNSALSRIPPPKPKPNLQPVTQPSAGAAASQAANSRRPAANNNSSGSSGPLRLGPGAAPPAAVAPPGNSGGNAVAPPSSSGPRSLTPSTRQPVTNFAPRRDPDPVSAETSTRAESQRVASAGDYVVQLAAMRSEAEANTRYTTLRRRHGDLLNGYGPLIERADLGDRGVFYRLRVGPIADKQTASKLCSDLRDRGMPDCIIRTVQ